MTSSYYNGQGIRLSGTFTVGGSLTDPTTVSLILRDPSGNEGTYTAAGGQVSSDATGIHYMDHTVDEAGIWMYKWIGTGAVIAVKESFFAVVDSII